MNIFTLSGFKCYNQIPRASTNSENVKKNSTVIFFGNPFTASLKKQAAQIPLPLWRRKGILI